MDELQGRFRRLDRIEAPDLWREAVARAEQLEAHRGRGFSPVLAFVIVALLLAALAGAIAVGAFIHQQPVDWRSVTFSNGLLVTSDACGRLTGVNESGATRKQLTTFDFNCGDGQIVLTDMVWALDGRSFAYVGNCVSSCEDPASIYTSFTDTGVWLMDARDGQSRRLSPCPDAFCHSLAIAPDGSLVAYISSDADGNASALRIASVDGHVARIIDLPGAPGLPAFSPDGQHLAVSVLGGKSGIYVVDLRGLREGVEPTPVVIHSWVWANNLTWSPNGQWIAFEAAGNGHTSGSASNNDTSEVWVERWDGSQKLRLASGHTPYGPTNPSWSADSSSVAYISLKLEPNGSGQRVDLWVAATDGSTRRLIFESACCIDSYTPPAWSPDGSVIALGVKLLGDQKKDDGLLLFDPSDGSYRRVSDFGWKPIWQPIPVVSGR